MSFAQQLKKVMEERNMTQSDLSAMTGIGKSSISQYLSGKNIPRESVIEKFADALECSVAVLKGVTNYSNTISDPKELRNVSVAEAAKKIGKSKQYVRVGLQRQQLPFGTAVMMSTRWSYHISPKLLDEYIRP